MKKELLIIVLLLLFSFPSVKSLLQPGGFTSHDLTHHIVRQISMDKLLSEGQFPPRWSGDLNNGYGYPVFLFNYPLPALLGEIFHKLGLNFVDSVKAVLFTSMILSVLGMHLFLKALLKNQMAAFLGAVFYLYAPIRFLNVYVSASVGAALALAVIPFIFWAMLRGKILLGSIFFGALILSHNVTTLIFAPVLLLFGFVLVRKVKVVALILLPGLGLSAWFWLPALFEKQYIRFDQIYSGFYKDQFINLWQLLRSPWGYGLSHPQNPEPGDMSYQLGLVHIGVMMVYGLWYMVYGRKIREVRVIGGFVFGFFILSIFLMLKISLPLWNNLPGLALVQFPLRFSAISIFCASIAAGLIIKYFPFKKPIFIGLLSLVIFANRNHWNINQVFDPGEDYYLKLQTTSTTYGEHLPKWGRVMNKPVSSKFEFINGGEKMRFNQFYFPGWQIEVDGKPVKFNYLTDGESYGLPVFDIDPGYHQIKAEFKNTADRNLADNITIITVIIIIIFICRQLIRK